MYKVKVNDKEFEIKPRKPDGIFIVDGKEVKPDIIKIKEGSYHLIVNYRSYNVEVIGMNEDDKTFEIKVNGNVYQLKLKDRYDELLHRLGMDDTSLHKINDLKAPMPGLVTGIHVSEGQKVIKGEVLVTLEAMKMENTLKAVADAVVKKVAVKKGEAVEKNEVLIYLV